MTFHVSCAVEKNYIRHSAAMLHSLLAGGGLDSVHVHYLHPPRFPAGSAARLSAMVENLGASASFIEVPDERCIGLPTKGFTGKATWYKIFLPEVLPEVVDRVLHLDVDLIVVDSLQSLWDEDLEGSYVAAVTNVLPPIYRERATQIGLANDDEYFNAGVLMMNLDLMRTEGCSRSLYSYGVEHAPELVLRDQDVLNVVLGQKRRHLHPRWNCMNAVLHYWESREVFGAQAIEEARANPAIRHFEGPGDNKPWHFMCDRPARELYASHRRETPWPRSRLEGVTASNVTRKVLRRARELGRSFSA